MTKPKFDSSRPVTFVHMGKKLISCSTISTITPFSLPFSQRSILCLSSLTAQEPPITVCLLPPILTSWTLQAGDSQKNMRVLHRTVPYQTIHSVLYKQHSHAERKKQQYKSFEQAKKMKKTRSEERSPSAENAMIKLKTVHFLYSFTMRYGCAIVFYNIG